MRFKQLDHTDLSRENNFQQELNNIAHSRAIDALDAERRRMNSIFRLFLSYFASYSTKETMLYVHFWNWMKNQIGNKREYSYEYMFDSVSEKLTLIKVEEIDGLICMVYTQGNGKKQWREHWKHSPMYLHWYFANKKAGKI